MKKLLSLIFVGIALGYSMTVFADSTYLSGALDVDGSQKDPSPGLEFQETPWVLAKTEKVVAPKNFSGSQRVVFSAKLICDDPSAVLDVRLGQIFISNYSYFYKKLVDGSSSKTPGYYFYRKITHNGAYEVNVLSTPLKMDSGNEAEVKTYIWRTAYREMHREMGGSVYVNGKSLPERKDLELGDIHQLEYNLDFYCKYKKLVK